MCPPRGQGRKWGTKKADDECQPINWNRSLKRDLRLSVLGNLLRSHHLATQAFSNFGWLKFNHATSTPSSVTI